jgi:peptidoglycan/xylan/chitin deacetylase (PgdA/CDA1 family)
MRYLKDNFPLVRLDADWSDVDCPSVAVTFDDGYADNVNEALPIIEELGIPSTFFISTKAIGLNTEFWWDDLERIILKSENLPEKFELETDCNVREWPTKSVVERFRLYNDFHILVKKMLPEQRDQHLFLLRSWANAGDKMRVSHRVATVDELKMLACSKFVTIGGHTVTHSQLSALPYDRQYEEITTSLRQLEIWLQREIKVFSYPFGSWNDFTADTVDICKKAGLFRAVANIPGQYHSWTDPYCIPRNLVRNWELPVFKQKLAGFWVS